jgi:glycosyltransferase involved in cell wall biosynthesis
MKISVITVCLNPGALLHKTWESLRAQDFVTWEWVVIDGASTDGTVDFVRALQAQDPRVRLVSEKDRGIYDAMNKGVRLATGDVVGFLNAADWFDHPRCLSLVAEGLAAHPEAGAVYGEIVLVSPGSGNRVVRHWKNPRHFARDDFRWGWQPPHPTFYARREVYERCGEYRPELRIAADYDLMLRCLYVEKVPAAPIPGLLVQMTAGGASNGSLKGIRRGIDEVRRSWGFYGLPTPLACIPGKLWMAGMQLVHARRFRA